MSWLDNALDRLRRAPAWGYHARDQSSSEPAALTALALFAWDLPDAARLPGEWLAKLQAVDGSVGIFADQSTPGWPTAWAIVAWRALKGYQSQIDRGLAWLLQMRGQPLAPMADLGHNPLLIGWPWVEGTHSWLEPTALAVLALNATGQASHYRTREAIDLISDRLLPTGGANYGNTTVLGQMLRPHVQPSGLALMALAARPDHEEKIATTCAYLRKNLSSRTTTVSLCYGVLGLTACGQRPEAADMWLQAAAGRTLSGDPSAYQLALLLLAARPDEFLSLFVDNHSAARRGAVYVN